MTRTGLTCSGAFACPRTGLARLIVTRPGPSDPLFSWPVSRCLPAPSAPAVAAVFSSLALLKPGPARLAGPPAGPAPAVRARACALLLVPARAARRSTTWNSS